MVRALREAARRGVRRSGRPRHRAVHWTLDSLEPRTLLSNVSWTGQGDGTTWTDASNWSNDAVPGPSDNVTISKSGNPTIAIAAGTQSVNSISSTDPISISGGSLSVAANSTLSGGLTMTGGSLTASGSGVSLTVTGTTTVSGASLEAEAGATLSLPQLTTASIPAGSSSGAFEAIGTGSTLNLSSLTGLGQVTTILYLEASQGGHLLLPALTAVTATSQDIQILADGTGSKIDLSGLTSLAPGDAGELSVTNQATVLDPRLTSLTNVAVTIDGTGTMAVGQWTTLATTSVDVTGGTTTLSGVTEVSVASGEQAILQATGSGATLSLPALTSPGSLQDWLFLEASGGGQLLLPGLSSDGSTSQYLEILADGSGSEIDLPALTTLASPNVIFDVTNQATVNLPKLTTVTGELNVLGGTVTLPVVTSVDGATVEVINGSTLTLPGLTSADGFTIYVNGGSTLILPAPTAFTATGSTIVSLTGAGSSIAIGSGILKPLPASGTGVTLNVPQFPQGMTLDLEGGTFSGGTTFNVGADATVEILNGNYIGGATFDVGAGATVTIPGGTFTGGAIFNVATEAAVGTLTGRRHAELLGHAHRLRRRHRSTGQRTAVHWHRWNDARI